MFSGRSWVLLSTQYNFFALVYRCQWFLGQASSDTIAFNLTPLHPHPPPHEFKDDYAINLVINTRSRESMAIFNAILSELACHRDQIRYYRVKFGNTFAWAGTDYKKLHPLPSRPPPPPPPPPPPLGVRRKAGGCMIFSPLSRISGLSVIPLSQFLFFCLVLLLFLSCHFSVNGPFSGLFFFFFLQKALKYFW